MKVCKHHIGSSGNQFKNAPIAGHCMAELIDACEKGHDHDQDPGPGHSRPTPGVPHRPSAPGT